MYINKWLMTVASFNSCPWVMVVGGFFQHYKSRILNDIPKSVLFPPETQYSLACVILLMEDILEESVRIIAEIHLAFTWYLMESKMNRIVGFKLSVWRILFSKIAPRYNIMELWYVKVDSDSSSAGTGTASLIIPPCHCQLLQQFNPCLLTNYRLCLLIYYQQFWNQWA